MKYPVLKSCARLARLHQPTGILLLLLPCWWGICLAYLQNGASVNAIELFKYLALFLIGSITMRSAGCIINDMWDRDIDKMVLRTKNRPLASRELSMKQAFAVLAIILLVGLGVVFQLNKLAIILGFLFCIPVVIYPLMKRFFPLPQAFLGLTFNAGALVGHAAIAGEVSTSAYILYAACIFWTLSYDTIYAHQDAKYDEKIGVKSTALTFGENSKVLCGFFMIIFASLFAGAAFFSDIYTCTILGLIVMLVILLKNLYILKLDQPDECMTWFCYNGYLGFLPFIGLLIDALKI